MNPENNLITVVTSKEITQLYKTFLEIIEDLQNDNKIMLDKVAAKTDKEFADTVNFFTPAKYEQLRKRILDTGNECSRQLLNFLDFFVFTIDAKKVQDAAQNKKIHKKIVISSIMEVK
jgi:hypothetical protein